MKSRMGMALAVTVALSIVAVAVGFASLPGEGHEAGNSPAICGPDCPGDCGGDCPGDCGREGCKGCDDGCGHGEGKAKAADKTEAKANTGGARLTKTKLVSLKGEGDESGDKCGHNGDHPEGHEGCKDMWPRCARSRSEGGCHRCRTSGPHEVRLAQD